KVQLVPEPFTPVSFSSCVAGISDLAAMIQVPRPAGKPPPSSNGLDTPRTCHGPAVFHAPPIAFTYEPVTGAAASLPNWLPVPALSPALHSRSSALRKRSLRLAKAPFVAPPPSSAKSAETVFAGCRAGSAPARPLFWILACTTELPRPPSFNPPLSANCSNL